MKHVYEMLTVFHLPDCADWIRLGLDQGSECAHRCMLEPYTISAWQHEISVDQVEHAGCYILLGWDLSQKGREGILNTGVEAQKHPYGKRGVCLQAVEDIHVHVGQVHE